MAAPISEKARDGLKRRIPTGNWDQATGQYWQKPMDGADVAGMVEPLLVAIEELEAEVAWLKGRA